MPYKDSEYVNRSEEYEVNYLLLSQGKKATQNNREIFLAKVNETLNKNELLSRVKAIKIIKELGNKLDDK